MDLYGADVQFIGQIVSVGVSWIKAIVSWKNTWENGCCSELRKCYVGLLPLFLLPPVRIPFYHWRMISCGFVLLQILKALHFLKEELSVMHRGMCVCVRAYVCAYMRSVLSHQLHNMFLMWYSIVSVCVWACMHMGVCVYVCICVCMGVWVCLSVSVLCMCVNGFM